MAADVKDYAVAGKAMASLAEVATAAAQKRCGCPAAPGPRPAAALAAGQLGPEPLEEPTAPLAVDALAAVGRAAATKATASLAEVPARQPEVACRTLDQSSRHADLAVAVEGTQKNKHRR